MALVLWHTNERDRANGIEEDEEGGKEEEEGRKEAARQKGPRRGEVTMTMIMTHTCSQTVGTYFCDLRCYM